jgi:hypothetical protein
VTAVIGLGRLARLRDEPERRDDRPREHAGLPARQRRNDVAPCREPAAGQAAAVQECEQAFVESLRAAAGLTASRSTRSISSSSEMPRSFIAASTPWIKDHIAACSDA